MTASPQLIKACNVIFRKNLNSQFQWHILIYIINVDKQIETLQFWFWLWVFIKQGASMRDPSWKGFPHKVLAMIWGMLIFLKCISQVHVSDMKRVPPHIPSFDLSYASMPPLCLESPTAPDTLSQGDQMTFLLSHACQYSAIFMTSSRKGWGYIVKAVDWSECG